MKRIFKTGVGGWGLVVALCAAPAWSQCVGVGGAAASPGMAAPALDGFVDASYAVITESPFAAPIAGGSASLSDSTGEVASATIYDTNQDGSVPDFQSVHIAPEGHTADIKKFHVTWDADYLYLAVEGPNAFHKGFGQPDRADLFVAIDTRDSRCTDATPVEKKGGDYFAKNVDFAGWAPNYFIGVEYCQLGGGIGYAHLVRADADAQGNVTGKVIVAADTVPNTLSTNVFDFNARRDTGVTEFRIRWSALGGRPDSCRGAAWNFAIYTTGNENGYDAFDTAPGVGQAAANGFETAGDCPFDADHCGARKDPVYGWNDSSCGYGESDNQSGAGVSNGPKVPSSDNSAAFNNNEVDTIQEYFRITNVGAVPGLPPSITCPGNVTTNVPCGESSVAVSFPAPTVLTGSCPVASVTVTPASGSLFPVGTTTVRCVASDAGGASNVCAFTVVVARNDAAPPAFSGVPADASVSCGQHEAFLSDPGTVTALDACDGARPVSFSAELEPQVPACPPFVITRRWMATDLAGNQAVAQQVITVIDAAAPMVTCPDDVRVYVAGTAVSTRVTYQASALDTCSGAASLTYSPTSGSAFVVGATSTVTVTASDACGNATQCAFNVAVVRSLSGRLSNCRGGAVTLDGFVKPLDEGYALLSERDFAAPASGGQGNHSDMIGEASARAVYDCNDDASIPDFSSINIETAEGHDADIEDLFITWDSNYLYLAVTGPNAFHKGFGPADRADLFVAIDTNGTATSLTSPVQKKGGDGFNKSVDFAGWSPDFFLGVEWLYNGGGAGHARLVRPILSAEGAVTGTQVLGADDTPNTITNSALEFSGRRDTAATEFRIKWSALGGRPVAGAPWKFAVYTTGNEDGFDLYDVAPGLGQGVAPYRFEVVGDTPFDGDHCNGELDPVTGVSDSSCPYGESDETVGSGLPNGPKVPSSDNSAAFNNNEIDTIQEYFMVANVGDLAGTTGCSPEAPGLKAEYYTVQNLTGPSVVRIDPNVNFDWGYGTPDPIVPADTFSARWSGQVEAKYSENTTFYVFSDDGCRLWVNGRLLIDNWAEPQYGEHAATISLVAGQRYDLVLEFVEIWGGASCKLSWSSASQPKQIVPADRFWTYPAGVNHQPVTPIFTEPPMGFMVNAEDLHIQTESMYNPIDDDGHRASDYLIYNQSTSEIVWAAIGVTNGAGKTHLHYGDGLFMNSHSGEGHLGFDSNFVLMARFRDTSGDGSTEWSPWSIRNFETSPAGGGDATNLWEVEHGYQVVVHSEGYQLPVSIVFVPNPGPNTNDLLYYVGELYGNIKAVRRDGTVTDYVTGALNFNPLGAFPGAGEQGMGDLCLDPASGDLFATMLYSPDPDNELAPHYPKVVRFFSSEDGLVATGRADVVAWEGEVQAASHQISDISIGPDGKLYVHIGDGFIASRGLDLNTVQGKICRINLDGTPAAGNPFYNAADGITARDYIWAYGYRNPWGGTWRAADGGHYEVENGPTRDRFAKVWAGQNARYDGSDNSMTNFALWTWKPPTAPVGVSFVEPQVFSGSGFPSSKWNSAFVTLTGPTWGTGPQTNLNASNGKRIQEFVLGASGQVTTQRWFLTYVGAGKATCAALAAGPDGLYFSDLYKDRDYQYAIDPGSKVWVVKYNASAAAAAATKPACRCAEGVPCAPQFSLGSTP